MTITLPDELREELERKAKAGGFASVDEYFIWLIESDLSDANDLTRRISDMPHRRNWRQN